FVGFAFGRGGCDRLLDRGRDWIAVFRGRRGGDRAFLWTNWGISGRVSGGGVHHRRVCGIWMGQGLSPSRRCDGDWIGGHFSRWLGMVRSVDQHAASRRVSDRSAALSGWRRDQDRACGGSVTDRLGVVEAKGFGPQITRI